MYAICYAHHSHFYSYISAHRNRFALELKTSERNSFFFWKYKESSQHTKRNKHPKKQSRKTKRKRNTKHLTKEYSNNMKMYTSKRHAREVEVVRQQKKTRAGKIVRNKDDTKNKRISHSLGIADENIWTWICLYNGGATR